MENVIFVCSQNRLRSPTAERIFHGHPKMFVESAGIDSDTENPLTPELLDWADFIFVMEESHREKLLRLFRANNNDQQIVCLGIHKSGMVTSKGSNWPMSMGAPRLL